MKSTQWKQDRETLRKLARDPKTGQTTIYALISHMRGKLHMRWYQKCHGGWRGPSQAELHHNDVDGWYCAGARIDNLEDQAAFIADAMKRKGFAVLVYDIAQRVLAGYPEEVGVAVVQEDVTDVSPADSVTLTHSKGETHGQSQSEERESARSWIRSIGDRLHKVREA